jgi:chromosome segregation ATPase
MILKELTINGFKSFAKKGELEFSAPITSIVGPNGSGKSNVAESFRFVLGEQSVKSMRGKRGEDLIWGGSTSVSRGNRASVAITFDNTKRIFPLDFDEITIERTVHRDGQNEYQINGSAVRLKDVQELLASAHIGASGHHIISQGEADRILTASAKERRDMLEDALGLRVFQYKKVEAERKLQKTKDNIAQVESLRREHAPHLKYLKKQVERAEKSLAVQKELEHVYAEYLKREDIYLAHHFDRLSALRQKPAELLADLKEQLEKAKQTLRAAETTKDSTALLEAEAKQAEVRTKRQAVTQQLNRLEGQVSLLESRIKNAKERAQKQSTELVPLVTVQHIVADIEKDIVTVLQKDDVSAFRRTLEDVVRMWQLFLKKVEPTNTLDTSADEQDVVELQKQIVTIRTTLATVETEVEAATSAYQTIKQAIEAEVHESHDAEKAVFTLVAEQRTVELELERLDHELAVIERDREAFRQEVQEAIALLKRAASHYFAYEIIDNGQPVTIAMIAAEPRNVQYERKRQLEKLKIRLEELGIGTTDDVIKEYQTALERDDFLARELDDLTASVEKLEVLITELNAQLHEQFVAGMSKINQEFTSFFALMFGGGNAALERVKPKIKKVADDGEVTEEESDAVDGEGVEISVSLPNKRVKGLEMLSGGERALTSIALIFAMSQVNPPPFIILDETDAALDEANSRRYGDMIEALAKKSQLILITHNRETMSRAGILYGVTMGADGVSKLLSVKFDEAVAVAK